MASITDLDLRSRRTGALRSAWRGFVEGLEHYMERHARTDRINALNARSDEELARMGLRREDIVRHVYRDRLYV